MQIREPSKSLTLEELQSLVKKHKERGREIIKELRLLESHFEKMQEYYSEWEDDLARIHKAIDEAKEDHGISQEEIEEFDALTDLLGETQDEKIDG